MNLVDTTLPKAYPRHDTQSGPAVKQNESEGAETSMCPCGARVPIGVRLHLRSRTRPVFEGRWCCSAECLRARVASAIRRATQDDAAPRPRRHRVPLGLLLLSAGSITHAELRHALRMQHLNGGRIGDVLVRECGLPERTVTEALAAQWGCPAWDVRGARPERLAALAPLTVLQRSGMVPLRLMREGKGPASFGAVESRLSVAFADEFEPQAIFALRRMHDVYVEAGIAPAGQWREASERMVRSASVAVEEVACDDLAEMQSVMLRTLRRLQPVESRWVRVRGSFWMRMWLEPAALQGGPLQVEDVADLVVRVPGMTSAEDTA